MYAATLLGPNMPWEGANVNAVDIMGRTARGLAVENHRKYAIEALDGEELTGRRFSGEISLNGNLHVPYCFEIRKASLMAY